MKKGIVFAMGDDLFTENPRISVHHSLTLAGDEAWILTIKDVTEADAGNYMCSLNTPKSLRKFYKLTVVGECLEMLCVAKCLIQNECKTVICSAITKAS